MSSASRAWARLRRNAPAMAGLAMAAFIAGVAIFGPMLYGVDPFDMLGDAVIAPGVDPQFPLGTDALGRDVLAGLISGARVSLVVGVAAMLSAIVIGIVVGSVAGYFGGVADEVLMRLTEFVQTIPVFLLVLALIAILGPSNESIVLAVCVSSWPPVARLVRAEFMSLREREFVQSCIVVGMGRLRIIFTQILPNSLAPVIVYSSIIFANAVLIEAALAFLGLGDPNVMSWGAMIGSGRESLRTDWYLSAVPGIAILLTVLSINLLGEGVNDALNARLNVR
ncbi:MAG: ABC transporter permease [Burkholderiales bacterium]|nr:ABC transporter permease [Burkholderiales bacterium]